MADAMPLDPDKGAARDRLGIPHSVRCLALLPGSRGAEVEMLSADFPENRAASCAPPIPICGWWCRWLMLNGGSSLSVLKAETAPDMIGRICWTVRRAMR
ncbi:hypothetical protein LNQ03_11390 [Klebsiella pneumoniae subsp. pneumoniae]|nr:hypothetical protein [Klebsiella pneumoniae subsp. pneumoniae]